MEDRFKFRMWWKDGMCYGPAMRDGDCGSGVDDYILMQSTGLKDKNGKLIYEGDICKIRYFGNCEIAWCADSCPYYREYLGWVILHPPWVTPAPLSIRRAQNSVVVGNIYEHPDLLK